MNRLTPILALLLVGMACDSPSTAPSTPPMIVEDYDKVMGKTVRSYSRPFGDFYLSYQPYFVSDEKMKEYWIDVRYWAEEPGTLQNGILYYVHPGGEVRKPLPVPQIVKTEPFYQQSGWGAGSSVYVAGTHYTIRVPLTLEDMNNLAAAGEMILRYPRFTSTPLEFRITNMSGFRGFLMPTHSPNQIK